MRRPVADGPTHNASTPWYKTHAEDSDSDHNRDHEFDLMTAASTPLQPSRTKLFVSPIKRLDKLHLLAPAPADSDSDSNERDLANCTIAPSSDDLPAHASQSGEYDPSAHSSPQSAPSDQSHSATSVYSSSPASPRSPSPQPRHSAADQSGVSLNHNAHTLPLHLPGSSDSDCGPLAVSSAPRYIRKRRLDSSSDMVITPCAPHTDPRSGLDMSGVMGDETGELLLKISFAPSESTPCPVHTRKRARFRPRSLESTPSQPSRVHRPLLDLTGSRKLCADEVPFLNKLNSAADDSPADSSSLRLFKSRTQSTPVSQLTPANSRPTSPDFEEDPGPDVNGFKFVRAPSHTAYQYSYQTPQSQMHQSNHLISAYNSNNLNSVAGNYEIVGEFPLSAAGLMSEDEDVHVGDKRINDPYAQPPPPSTDTSLYDAYLSAGNNKLPLHVHFERELSTDEMNRYINDGHSVSDFYTSITLDVLHLLKKERLRWHPDKWESRLGETPYAKSTIDCLSQVINAMIEDLAP